MHLLATPVSRSLVVAVKYAVATVLTMVFVAIPELLAGLIATGGATKLALGLFVGALAGSVMYNAVFVMISVLTTRAIAVGLLYALIWEGVLANLVPGARLLSIGQYSLGIANSIAHNPGLNAALSPSTAVVLGLLVTAAALVVAARRLASWLAGIAEWPRSVGWIERLGLALAGHDRCPGYFVPGIALRNALFMLIVLAHGFRRLAPPY